MKANMRFFENIPLAPPDPVLGLNVAFKKDARAEKINLGVGSYKTSESASFVLNCVRQAEEFLVKAGLDKEYLPIDGDEEFLRCTRSLVFGEKLSATHSDRILGVQALGGTGGLRIGGDFLFRHSSKKIYIPDLTWINHKPVFTAAGMDVEQYPYFDASRLAFDFSRLCSFIRSMVPGSVIVLQASCHNPTGTDPSPEQWKELASLIHQQGLLPFFDFAYQGFGEDIEEDAFSIRLFANVFEEMIVAYSFSKNFGLYGERVGALFIQAASSNSVEKARSQMKIVVRQNYSNPPCHGARIVKTVYENHDLRRLWQIELKQMRERVMVMRRTFASGLAAKKNGAGLNFDAVNNQTGLFAFLGLGKDQVSRLIREYGIYLPDNGRINLAGLNSNNMEYVIDAILST